MTRGRKPLPTSIKVINGSFSKNPKRRNKKEPVAPDGAPECPDYLSDLAKIEWWYMCSILNEMGLASRAARAALEIYCQTIAEWRHACEMVARHGAVIQMKTKSGGIPKRNPFDLIRERTAQMCAKMLTEFGLTPSSRSRVQVDRKATDDFSEFLKASDN